MLPSDFTELFLSVGSSFIVVFFLSWPSQTVVPCSQRFPGCRFLGGHEGQSQSYGALYSPARPCLSSKHLSALLRCSCNQTCLSHIPSFGFLLHKCPALCLAEHLYLGFSQHALLCALVISIGPLFGFASLLLFCGAW